MRLIATGFFIVAAVAMTYKGFAERGIYPKIVAALCWPAVPIVWHYTSPKTGE